jgi:hypothetical protein
MFGFVDDTLPCPSETIPNPDAGTTGALATISNPQYYAWHQQDQSILSAIICSLFEGVIGMVINLTTSQEAWETLESSFASQTVARAMQIRSTLNKTRKLDSSAAVFFNKVKALSDQLTSIGQPLRSEEFSAFLLQGLDSEYDSLAQLVSARALTDPMPVKDIYSQLLATEQRIDARRAELNADVHHMANWSARGSRPSAPQQQFQE